MNGDVECHNSEIRQQADHVGSLRVTGEMEDVQQALLAHMVSLLKSNQRLQNDLMCTRYRMEEQAQEIDHARREARTDALTSVANRKAFDEKLRVLLAEWERDGIPFVLILADLDHLKRINDSHGHPAGDHVLKIVGSWLRQWVRHDDFVARYGGDEFAILLPRTQLETGMALAEKVRAQVAERASGVTFRGEQVSLSLSVGVAVVRVGDTVDQIMYRADQALLKSKRRGRNQVTCEGQEEVAPEPALSPDVSGRSSVLSVDLPNWGQCAAWSPSTPGESPAAFPDF
ncbi:MAG: GGDEF domain-containing protein [Thermoguttaceae bacterium]|nr:GGDEF domain-containing protein [Thermoguttaceae bacterium]